MCPPSLSLWYSIDNKGSRINYLRFCVYISFITLWSLFLRYRSEKSFVFVWWTRQQPLSAHPSPSRRLLISDWLHFPTIQLPACIV